jgi:hypothetical protein
MEQRYTRLAPSADDESAQLSATAPGSGSGICSDQRVGRDNMVVFSDGLSFTNILLSGSMQWAHDDSLLPIAVPKRVQVERDLPYKPVRIFWKYVSRDANPFAGQVEDLVAAGCLRALSLSWMPIKWEYSDDRPGGVDFLAADAIEVSFVPSPALPTALIDAQRSRPIDTKPLYEWAQHALETRSYRALPRPQLEAIARSARPRLSRESDGRAERQRRARELIDKGLEDRRRVARKIAARVRRENIAAHVQRGGTLNTESQKGVVRARGHLARALKHHRKITDHHGQIAGGVKQLRSIHRRLSSTLEELGYRSRSSKADPLDDFEECIRALSAAHGDAEDAALNAATMIDNADQVLVDTFAATAATDEDDD